MNMNMTRSYEDIKQHLSTKCSNRLTAINPFAHTAILQQVTFRKILNVHSAGRNEHFFKLESFENIVAIVTMFSNVVCCSRRKNEYLWSKGLS